MGVLWGSIGALTACVVLLWVWVATGRLRRPMRVWGWCAVAGVPLLALSLYGLLGASAALHERMEMSALQARLGSVEALTQRLAAQLRVHPEAEGFALLGRLYLKTQQFAAARSALARAYTLSPDRPAVLTAYAQALLLTHPPGAYPPALALLDRALVLQPGYPDALNLRALYAYGVRDYRGAVRDWEALLPLLPADAPELPVLQSLLSQSRQQIAAAPVSASRVVVVQVSLAKRLRARLRGDESVFVVAQAVNGPSVPLAVVKRAVSALPLTVTLDDSHAMLAASRLSDVPFVVVTARVSRTGQALPAPGDLEGRSRRPVQTTRGQAVVVIDTVR